MTRLRLNIVLSLALVLVALLAAVAPSLASSQASSRLSQKAAITCQFVSSGGYSWYECGGVRITQRADANDRLDNWKISGGRAFWSYIIDANVFPCQFAFYSNSLTGNSGTIVQITQTGIARQNNATTDFIAAFQVIGNTVVWQYRNGAVRQYAFYANCVTGGTITRLTQIAYENEGDAILNFAVSGNTAQWNFWDGLTQQWTWHSTTLPYCSPPTPTPIPPTPTLVPPTPTLIPPTPTLIPPTPTLIPPTPTKTPTPCPGTAHKWQSDYYGQTPYQSPGQPNPSVCLSDDRCLYSAGGAVNHGTINGVWICSWGNLEGRHQGVWYQCEATRANANKVIEGYECELVGSNYAWVPVN